MTNDSRKGRERQSSQLYTRVTASDNGVPSAEKRYAVEGSYAGYLVDLLAAWDLADLEGQAHPTAIGWQVRLALIHSSIRALSANLSPEMLVALLNEGIWPGEAVVNHARGLPDVQERVDTLIRLGVVANEHGDDGAARLALSSIVDSLAEWADSDNLLRPREQIADPLQPLMSLLTPTIATEALARVRGTNDRWARLQIFCAFGPHLPATLLPEALAVARRFHSAEDRALALASLAPCLTPELADEALAAAADTGEYSTWTVGELLPSLGSDAARTALSRARETADAEKRMWLLTRIAAHLDVEEHTVALVEAVDAARAIEDAKDRAEALSELSRTSGTTNPELVAREAFAAAHEVPDAEARAELIGGLLSHLDESERLAALTVALEAARAVPDARARGERLLALLPSVTAEQAPGVAHEVMRCAQDVEYAGYAVDLIAGAIPHLSSAERPEAIDTLLAVHHPYDRPAPMVAAALLLPESEQVRVFALALRAISEDNNGASQAGDLAEIAPLLPPPLHDTAFAIVRGLGHRPGRLRLSPPSRRSCPSNC